MAISRSRYLGFTWLAGGLFLASPARAQDDKDREIEKLKAIIAVQQKAADRVAQEAELLRKTIAEREKSILQLEAKVQEYKRAAVNFEAMAKTRQLQTEALLKQVQELTQRLAVKEAGKDPPPKQPGDATPPSTKVEGKISKVAGKLVEVNVGTDHGLKEGHTLEVYRLDPMPKYIGRIRITDARQNMAVGRMLGKELPKEGDQVTSNLK